MEKLTIVTGKLTIVMATLAFVLTAQANEYHVQTNRGAVAINLPSRDISTRILVDNMMERIDRLERLCSRYPAMRAEANALLTELVALIVLLPSSCMDNVVVVENVASAGPYAMDAATFGEFLRTLEEETFSSSQMKLVRRVSGEAYFTCSQLGELIDAFDYATDKIEVARVLRSRIVDAENAFTVKDHFTYETDKERFMKMFYAE